MSSSHFPPASYLEALLAELTVLGEQAIASAKGQTADDPQAFNLKFREILEDIIDKHPRKSELEWLVDQQGRILRAALAEHKNQLQDAAQVYIRKFGIARNHSVIARLASDIFQDASEKVSIHSFKFNILRLPNPWLRMFIKYETLTLRQRWFREKKVITFVDEIFSLENIPLAKAEFFDNTTADTKVRPVDLKNLVKKILNRLRPDDHLILWLRFYKGVSGKALAEELSRQRGKAITRGAAYVRLSRAKDRFEREFLQYFGGNVPADFLRLFDRYRPEADQAEKNDPDEYRPEADQAEKNDPDRYRAEDNQAESSELGRASGRDADEEGPR